MKSLLLLLACMLVSTPEVLSIHQRITGCESVSSQCPAENTGVPIHLPNPIDCGSFCKCDHGNAIYFACPPGLHFSVEHDRCEWPAIAKCDLTPPSGTGCDAVTCPPENGAYALHLPNPDDCTSFCTCNWGEAIHMDCPSGLHFNPILMVCDWPEYAGCQSDTPIEPPTDPNIKECGHIKCPSDNEFVPKFPNPWNCNSYCSCDDGKPIIMTCPDGLYFNPQLQVCDLPQNAKCDGGIYPVAPTMTPGETPPASNGCANVVCPPENGEVVLNLPNPNDCESFCTCNWGVGIYQECPSGLHFNPILQVCDWPENANCEVEVENGCELVTTCPPDNNGDVMHFPNPNDCGSFCKCDWGEAIYFDCPGNLHFNPILQVCDWPENVNCESSNLNTIPATNAPENPTPTSSPLINGCSKVQCPLENGEYALHLPNPDDCGSFCVCDWGNAILVECPPGLHFNSQLQVCDWPENVNCNINTGNGCELVSCPPENEGNAIHLPNPINCASFCKCDWGNAIYFDCPPGLLFNSQLQVCVWPENSDCDLMKPNNSQLPSEHSIQIDAQNGCAKVTSCPAENGADVIHLPNPEDCGSFCKCDWGVAVYFECPAGLHFNAVLEVCDWPENANCNINTGNGCELVTTCPPENSGNAILVPNPINCASFCMCDWGNPIYFDCPSGLHFNPILQTCDYPENVNCVNIRN